MEILRFKPLLKQTLWGGDRLKTLKQSDTTLQHIGESWELSGVEGNETVVDGGPYDGTPLNTLVARLKGDLVGQDNYRLYGDRFPLLFKFIDAHQDLSIQVHPNDAVARRHGLPCGKTEMWYVLPSDAGAQLYCGLCREVTAADYRRHVADDTVPSLLARYSVREGDVFYIPAGRIHALGAGCMVAEIQQTSDATYRIYDYNRRDSEGRLRQLHTEQAAESIDYAVLPDYRTHYDARRNEPQTLVQCPYFTTSLYDLDEPMLLDYSDLDSFVVLMGLHGSGTLSADGGQPVTLRAGETLLVPATVGEVAVGGALRFLEVFA